MRRAAWIFCLCLPLVAACGEGNDDKDDDVVQGGLDASVTPGVCVLSTCPQPEQGVACCLPVGRCGQDPTGSGLACQPNPGDSWTDAECRVAECPLPTIGNPCCTAFGSCGNDPFGLGTVCYANAPIDRRDAAQPEPTCAIDECPLPDVGFVCCTNDDQCGVDPNGLGVCWPNPEPVDAAVPEPTCPIADCPLPVFGFSCCTNDGECGVDPNGLGVCYPPPEDAGMPEPTCDIDACPVPEVGLVCCTNDGGCGVDPNGLGVCYPPVEDAGVPPEPDFSPPDDPSITGECPSYLGPANLPIWGCCSGFGVCGTWNYDACLLPVGTQLPVGPPPPVDAGIQEPFLRCEPPQG